MHNILLVMTDQQRWDAMGCSGGWVNTPTLDRLAKEGIRFSNCVTNSPVCVPARASLATGLYPHNSGIWQNINHDLPVDSHTWMQSVRNAGYRTSLFGKTHLHRHQGDLRDREHLLHAYGLDDIDEIGGPWASAGVLSHMTERWQRLGHWDALKADYKERSKNKPYLIRPSTLPLEEYPDVYVGRQAREYLEAYDRSEPWFCWVSFGGPHEPWDTPEPYASMYCPEDMPKPVLKPEERTDRPRGYLDTLIESSPELSADEIASMRAGYAGNVTLIDDQIGKLLETIEQRGELNNTVIVFVSDHGELNGDYGLLYKDAFLNGSVRVPLIIRTPGTLGSPHAGSVADCPTEWFDIGPTLVEMAGGTIGYQQFAKSLCPVLRDPAAQHRPYAISEVRGEIMYLDKKWKLFLTQEGIPYGLFDLEQDPCETHNLVTDIATAELQTEIRLRIQEHLVRTQIRQENQKQHV
jgi:choline-sulfatase